MSLSASRDALQRVSTQCQIHILLERYYRGISPPESEASQGLQQSEEVRSAQKGVPTAPKTKRFRVALSFPGEHRRFVSEVASCLARNISQEQVFYDKYYEAELARPDLDTYLQSIYHDQSELIVVFLCADYANKEWCGLEWRAVRDLLKKKQAEMIMPIRFDDTQILGLFSIDGYVNVDGRSPDTIAALIVQRLDYNAQQKSLQ